MTATMWMCLREGSGIAGHPTPPGKHLLTSRRLLPGERQSTGESRASYRAVERINIISCMVERERDGRERTATLEDTFLGCFLK